MQDILYTTELACAYLAATASLASDYNGGTVNIYTGMDNLTKDAPAITCWAESATEYDYLFSGQWMVRMNVSMKEMASSASLNNFGNLVGDIESQFLSQNIEGVLANSVPNYYVYQVKMADRNFTISGDAWNHTLGLDILCTITSGSTYP